MENKQILKQSILNNDLAQIKTLLWREPKLVNAEDEDGVSMSLLIARTGDIEIIKYLVEYTVASFNLAGKDGRTCLHEAVLSESLEAVKYFVERVGMSPVKGDKNLVTPYQLAYENNLGEILDYFEEVVGAKYEDMYHNPIRTGFYADPSIVRVGEDYYMVNSSFVFFPCIPISHSTDLVHWKVIGHAITNPEWAYIDELEGGRGYWAPDISYNDGRFYITATLRLNDGGEMIRRQIVVSSDKPEGPYSKPAFIDEDGIDPSIFTDTDGRRYMLLNRGARIFELNHEATEKIGEASLLYYGYNKRAPEGPHLLYKDGYYYLFEAEGGTGIFHQITVSRSKTLMGVYEPCPYNPIMTQRDSQEAIQCCGHGKPVMTQNGDWYIVFLCSRFIRGEKIDGTPEDFGLLGRETCLEPITWTPDGWPIINGNRGPSALQIKPNLPETASEESSDGYWFDDFDGQTPENGENALSGMRPDWITSRTPEPGSFALSGGKLKIKGSKYPLSSTDAKGMVVRRQENFDFDVTVKMPAPKFTDASQNAGITGYYDENTYFTYGVYKTENGYSLKLFEKIDELEKYTFEADIADTENIYLKICTTGLKRRFLYSIDGENWNELGTVENLYYICSQAINKGKRFTGAMIGLYAYAGENEACAEFDSFEYRGY